MITKKDLIKILSARTLYTQKECKVLVDNIFEIMEEKLLNGNDISIVGFGKFEIKKQKPRPVRNPKTGSPMMLSEHRVVKFRPSRSLKSKIKEDS